MMFAARYLKQRQE